MTNETENDPLAMPANELEEPKFPLLKEGIYTLVVRSNEEGEASKENEKTGIKSKMWILKLATTENKVSTEDQTVYAGAAVFHRFMLTATPEKSLKQLGEIAAMAIKAAYGNKEGLPSVRDCLANPSLMNDKLVQVKLGIKKGNDGYPDSNVVKNWIVPA